MNNVIAERELIFVSPEGKEMLSSLQFGMPYSSERHGYCVDFEIPQIEKLRFGAGVDGIQALLLTMSLAESILASKCSEGWKILWPDSRHETNIEEIFEIEHFELLRK